MWTHPLRHFSVVLVAALAFAACEKKTPAQPASPPACSFGVSRTSFDLGPAGGTDSVTVTTASGCTWNASSDRGWVTITGGATGSGNGTVSVAIAANTSGEARTATLAVASQHLPVRQEGLPCTVSIEPASASYGDGGGSGTIAISVPSSCVWTATSTVSWLSITTTGAGSGSGVLGYSVAENNSASARSGTITAGGQIFTVSQASEALPPPPPPPPPPVPPPPPGPPPQPLCSYSVAPVEFTPCMSVPFEMTATVTTEAGCTWTAAPQAPWITLTDGASGIGPGTVKFRVTDNYDEPRLGQIFVRWPTPTAGQNLRISQAGCRYAVSVSAFNFTAVGGTGRFDVLQQSEPLTCGGATQDRCVWSAVADVPWITITTPMPSAGDNPVNFVVAPNSAGTRSGTIRVRDKTIHVTQAGS